ncbi:MAG: protein-serine/threonine phosphatase [Pleurocapsa sp. SU_5_0]|nr:protein-serine/threonine phosphatase [Pleurocapsa sp. SU_5_0]NJO94810.1 protein-serine/threonine phosphatase [Pleurocapsa sp. CRU_1_2]NJR44833.1 protein-serine/threonine phosphatase [Hyellaceae cyanobacterium CSU_1_1]
MSHPEPRIQCSNSQCLASNDLEAILCDRCNTPIIRRYLWSSQAIAIEQKQTLIQERYLALTEQIFLDTQPSSPPLTPEEVPPEIVVYLQLFSYYPHIPQPYGLLSDRQIWLFDYGTVPASPTGELAYPQELIPKAQDLWFGATPLQQLNWLWQIAKLWHPLSQKGVAATLLEPNLIRVNGQILQLRQLQTDIDRAASLQDLGNLWSRWATHAHPNIKEVVFKLASNLETGVIAQANQLVGLLDRAISLYCQTQQYSYQTYAQSDSGPSRSNNEDAAYPLSSHLQEITGTKNGKNGLAIVCDGVGGHDGGEIASEETIDYLQGKISALKLDKLKPHKISSKLAQYIKDANDLINQRNDVEHRQERQRMGTTLVMALAHAQEIYLGHIGDSRIYWITRNSCHQMTVDDDLASREVRLGYALYRDSLQYPSAGALIQALGMRGSAALHPNLQRYIIDDECVFLLCTDGLSDFDRIEQQWRQSILPLLEGKQDLTSTVKDLIALANDKNGHDNVTVALVHCQINSLPGSSQAAVSWSDLEIVLTESAHWSENDQFDSDPAAVSSGEASLPPAKITQKQISEPIGEPLTTTKQSKWTKVLIFALVLATIVGLFAYRLRQDSLDPDPDPTPPLPRPSETDTKQ